jgi:hypothetical protein
MGVSRGKQARKAGRVLAIGPLRKLEQSEMAIGVKSTAVTEGRIFLAKSDIKMVGDKNSCTHSIGGPLTAPHRIVPTCLPDSLKCISRIYRKPETLTGNPRVFPQRGASERRNCILFPNRISEKKAVVTLGESMKRECVQGEWSRRHANPKEPTASSASWIPDLLPRLNSMRSKKAHLRHFGITNYIELARNDCSGDPLLRKAAPRIAFYHLLLRRPATMVRRPAHGVR